jgi:thymidine kinase
LIFSENQIKNNNYIYCHILHFIYIFVDMNNNKLSNAIGSLKILFGPMFSGKTTTLLNILSTYVDINMKVLYINHTIDIRLTKSGNNVVTSHSSQFKGMSTKIVGIKTDCLKNIDIDNYDVIGVDEAQFFDDLEEVVRQWVLIDKKIVIISSLDGDHQIRPIGHAHKLVCLCESGNIDKLSAKCKICLEKIDLINYNLVKASFTLKTTPNKSEQIEVGNENMYKPVCLKCHQNNNI